MAHVHLGELLVEGNGRFIVAVGLFETVQDPGPDLGGDFAVPGLGQRAEPLHEPFDRCLEQHAEGLVGLDVAAALRAGDSRDVAGGE